MLRKILWLFFLVVMSGSQVWASQVVSVVYPFEEDKPRAAKSTVLEQGFAMAAVRETLEIVPGQLSETRQKVLEEYFVPHSRKLVLSYTELEYQQTSEEMIISLDVTINRPLLKSMLKKIGVFYTSESPWPYTLTLSGAEPEDMQVLQDMQLLSGLKLQGTDGPSVVIRKSESGEWRGELLYKEHTFSKYDQELNQLWVRLLSTYFTLPEVAQKYIQETYITAEGWFNTDALEEFDKTMTKWVSFIEEVQLLQVDMNLNTIQAKWKVTTRDINKLKSHLDEYFALRGLIYTMDNNG